MSRRAPGCWTGERLADEIRGASALTGRMPTTPELRRLGRNDLATAISSGGGFAWWAKRLGLALAGTETHRGHAIEMDAQDFLCSRGYEAERQTTLAPYDLLVNGLVRVDVKSAAYRSYTMPSGGHCSGHFFGLGKPPHECDLLMLCGVDAENKVLFRYFVPAEHAQVQTLTLTSHGKYERFRDAIHHIDEILTRPLREFAQAMEAA